MRIFEKEGSVVLKGSLWGDAYKLANILLTELYFEPLIMSYNRYVTILLRMNFITVLLRFSFLLFKFNIRMISSLNGFKEINSNQYLKQ